jgi:hypothetical protein
MATVLTQRRKIAGPRVKGCKFKNYTFEINEGADHVAARSKGAEFL